MDRLRTHTAFTLIELMIVLIILAILATIVVAKLSNSAEESRRGTTVATLRSVRSQLEVYRLQHDDRYPRLTQLWDAMMRTTDTAGNPDPAGELGPYLRTIPYNPYTRSHNAVAPGTGTLVDGWEYNEVTGALSAVGYNESTGVYIPPEP